MSIFAKLALEMSEAFEVAIRHETRSPFYRIREGAPDWLNGLMLEVHFGLGGRLPDDWTYAATAAIAEGLTGYDLDTETPDSIREAGTEVARGLVDEAYHEVTAWLADHVGNIDLVEEVREDYGADGTITELIRAGQELALERIAYRVVEWILAEAEKRDE